MTDTRPQSSASIVERLRAYWPDGPGHQIAWEAAAEIERLRNSSPLQMEKAINEKLQGENLALLAEIERLHADIAQHIHEKINLATEVERLRADNEWLHKTMRNAIAAQDWNEARRALEGK